MARRPRTPTKYRCIICRRGANAGRRVTIGGNGGQWVLCAKCNREWLWYPGGRYFRRRESESRWKGQSQLVDTVTSIVKGLGIDSRSIISEVGFPDWGISTGGGLLRYDVAVPKLRLLVDYHGVQHYTPDNRFHRGNMDKYNRQRDNDKLKAKLSGINGWNYVVFSYREQVDSIEWVRKRLGEVGVGR